MLAEISAVECCIKKSLTSGMLIVEESDRTGNEFCIFEKVFDLVVFTNIFNE